MTQEHRTKAARARGVDPDGSKVRELLDRCRSIYEAEGFDGLTFGSLKRAGLYFPLYYFGVTQAHLLERLGLSEKYAEHKATQPFMRKGQMVERWTWERILTEARKVRDDLGFLPPAGWFQANGLFSLVHHTYRTGHTWEDVRDALGDFQSSLFVESRSGLRWRSHPEASLSNFLYARGVEHTRGERYPDGYEEATGRAYGLYDLHFLCARGRMDVEIWGDDPGGHGADEYGAKRAEKERFNSDNPNFLGIAFKDCFDEGRLSAILAPYIGTVEPFVFDRPTDSVIQSTHWSNTDELLEYCRHLAAQMSDGAFPTEECGCEARKMVRARRSRLQHGECLHQTVVWWRKESSTATRAGACQHRAMDGRERIGRVG
jgi:hypothetical protein